MTYNTGAKKTDRYCPDCFGPIIPMKACIYCGGIFAECDTLSKEEAKAIKR